MNVATRFRTLLENISPTSAQIEDGSKKHRGVRACLNSYYYNSSSETANSFLIGSWSKVTRIKPPGDVDLYFRLPADVYHEYAARAGNRQSQLLQEVRGVLRQRYPATNIKGDGPVVLVPFSTLAVEIVPAFQLADGRYYVCDTKGGGRYRQTAPNADFAHFKDINEQCNGKMCDLVRLMKRWIYYCNVPIKSYHVELLAADFLSSWAYRYESEMYYDWMVRDFLARLQSVAGSFVYAPDTYEMMCIGDAWQSKAGAAYEHAYAACDYEGTDRPATALAEWREIFGYAIK